MKKICLLLFYVLSLPVFIYADKNFRYDLTIVGNIRWCGGLGRLPISLTRLFKNELSINSIHSPGAVFDNVLEDEKLIFKNLDKSPGRVAILFDLLWSPGGKTLASAVPEKSLIKIAYSMLEGTSIPQEWVNILNKKFDLVVVPDEYYEVVYSKCGVKIPIFVLPHGIHLEDLLQQPITRAPTKPFVFGCSAAFIPRKNHELLIEAFQNEFGNDRSVMLKIHGRDGFEETMKKISNKRKNMGNIEIINARLTNEQYIKFLQSLDCYVLLSKGEGFSLTPREALALGKPCIISNNTAHNTIAKSGYVYAVTSDIKEPAFYTVFGKAYGYNFNCKVRDVQEALRQVYTNYDLYLKKAESGRIWVKQYLWSNVKTKFLNLIKPNNVIFGDKNIVTDTFIMTSSEKLYSKYLQLLS